MLNSSLHSCFRERTAEPRREKDISTTHANNNAVARTVDYFVILQDGTERFEEVDIGFDHALIDRCSLLRYIEQNAEVIRLAAVVKPLVHIGAGAKVRQSCYHCALGTEAAVYVKARLDLRSLCLHGTVVKIPTYREVFCEDIKQRFVKLVNARIKRQEAIIAVQSR